MTFVSHQMYLAPSSKQNRPFLTHNRQEPEKIKNIRLYPTLPIVRARDAQLPYNNYNCVLKLNFFIFIIIQFVKCVSFCTKTTSKEYVIRDLESIATERGDGGGEMGRKKPKR